MSFEHQTQPQPRLDQLGKTATKTDFFRHIKKKSRIKMSCACVDPQTLDTIRSLIKFVEPIKRNNEDFPEAFCDVVTAQIYLVNMVAGVKPQCGRVSNARHLWVKVGDTNIDFTAHQFPSLHPHIINVDGFDVLYGTDKYFKAIGFEIYPRENCTQQLIAASNELLMGEFGDCSVCNDN